MSAWEKRVVTMTSRGVAQNMALGVRYFRFEAIGAGPEESDQMRLGSPLEVLEEVGAHGRVVIALPGERRLAVYAVDPAAGRPGLAWYEREELLVGV
ncbi:MAG TPA: hypothetical protein VFO60_04235 [Candidatus Dormibacteraeota bacterium]|nr:hypothetical protein [Candidatus Dormibacteraeota bacterium]